MLLTAYLEVFHSKILLNWQLYVCYFNSNKDLKDYFEGIYEGHLESS